MALILAACGGSSSSSSTEGGGATAAESEPENETETETASSQPEDSGVEEAAATITEYSKPYKGIGVTEPLKTLPKGKHFYYLPCPSEVCLKDSVEAMESAAGAMGAHLKVVPEGATPDETTSAWNTATGASPAPDGLFWGGVPPQVVKSQIAQLAGKKVPIIAWGASLNNKPEGGTNWPGVALDLAPISWAERNGELMADWIIADSKGEANTLFVNFPDYTLFNSELAKFEKQTQELCPECKVSSIGAKATDFGTNLPGQVVSALQRDPEINYVVFAYGDMVLGVPEALAGAELSGQVKIVSQSGGKKNYEYIEKGEQAADIAFDNRFIGWKAMDTLARLAAGESGAADTGPLPTRILTQENLKVDPETGEAEVAPGYEQEFEELWGLK